MAHAPLAARTTAAARDRVLTLESRDPRVAPTRSAILGACERLIERGDALDVQSIASLVAIIESRRQSFGSILIEPATRYGRT